MKKPGLLESANRELQKYLENQGLDKGSIDRILEEDLPFLSEWQIKASDREELSRRLRSGHAAVLAFAFGFGPARQGVPYPPEQYHPMLCLPGKSNEGLAKVISQLVGSVGNNEIISRVFAQWEVAEALKENNQIIVPDTQIARPRGEYLGTRGVVEQLLDRGLRDFPSIIIVAHPHHLYRCRKTTEAVLRKRHLQIDVFSADTSSVSYDPQSVQPWTRSPGDWVRYEVGNRFKTRYQGNM
jgi:hypothetical protein